jgi:hypothetical protein
MLRKKAVAQFQECSRIGNRPLICSFIGHNSKSTPTTQSLPDTRRCPGRTHTLVGSCSRHISNQPPTRQTPLGPALAQEYRGRGRR